MENLEEVFMKNSLKMLLKNIRSNYHFGSSDQEPSTPPIIIPDRKKQSDLVSLFEETQKNSEYLEKSEISFNFFSIGYMFNVDRLLNLSTSIRYSYNSKLITKDEVFERLFDSVSTVKTRDYIKSNFEKIFKVDSSDYDIVLNSYKDEATQKNFISFIYGYNKAHKSAINIYKKLKKDYIDNKRDINYFVYYFWDFLSSELIELNKNSHTLVKEYINVYV
jgi:hypothetical protein